MRRSRASSYTPYKTAPPKSRLVRGSRRRSPSAYKQTRLRTSKSPKGRKFKKTRTTKRKKVRGERTIEAINMIDYGDAYRTPDTYYVRDSRWGKVYSCPKPKNNLLHVNEDPTLGGSSYKPSAGGICSTFNKATKRTPMSSYYTRVIPWDHKDKDYVYGAVQDSCFKGYYDRRSLKSKIDLNRHESSWDPVSTYNLCFYLTVGLIALAILLFVILMIIHWGDFKYNWRWWFFWLILGILILLLFCCLCRYGANSRTKKRYQRIHEACEDINKRNLYGTGTQVWPGESAGWLEVEMDPRRTVIRGPPRHDSMSYNLQPAMAPRKVKAVTTTEHVTRTAPRRQKIIEETTIVRGENASGIGGIRRSDMLHGSQPPSQMSSFRGNSDYSRLNQESAYKSNFSRSPSPVPQNRASYNSSGADYDPASSKKMSFYEKLRASKSGGNNSRISDFNSGFSQSRSGASSYMTPVQNRSNNVSQVSRSNASFGQSRNTVTHSTGKALNLMAASPRR